MTLGKMTKDGIFKPDNVVKIGGKDSKKNLMIESIAGDTVRVRIGSFSNIDIDRDK